VISSSRRANHRLRLQAVWAYFWRARFSTHSRSPASGENSAHAASGPAGKRLERGASRHWPCSAAVPAASSRSVSLRDRFVGWIRAARRRLNPQARTPALQFCRRRQEQYQDAPLGAQPRQKCLTTPFPAVMSGDESKRKEAEHKFRLLLVNHRLGGEVRETNYMTQQEQKVPSNPPVVRRKIPISLSVVSYIFFTIGLLAAIRGFAALAAAKTYLPFSPVISLLLGMLYMFLSRGLRRCSRGWHICALVFISCGLIMQLYQTVHFVLTGGPHSTGASLFIFAFALILVLSVQVWMLQVLIRRDVRYLFYGSHDHAI